MSRVVVELTLVGDEVAVKNVTETKKIVTETKKIVSQTNKVYYKKHGVEDAKFIEIVQNEVVYVHPDDRVFLCDVNRIHKDKHVDYSFTVSGSSGRVYAAPMRRIATFARGHYLVKKDGTSQDVPGGVAAYVKGVHAMLDSKGSWTAGPDGFSLDGFMVVHRDAITKMATPSRKRKATD
jgi:hypothetical protein